jgi:mono/diheme cytochrome c family protein
MTHSRTLFSPLVATLVTVSLGLHTAGALETRGVKQYGALPARFLTVIRPVASANLALQAEAQKAKEDDPLPDGKGKDVTKRVCSGCHAVTVFAKERHTPEKWAAVVDNMVSRGMEASDEELDTINTYLSTNLAPPKDAPPAPSSAPPSKQ